MFYQNMPLYLKLLNLLKAEYRVVHNLPKEYKFSLGQDILNRTWGLVDLFIAAQAAGGGNNKSATVQNLNRNLDQLKPRIRFLGELKLVSLGQFSRISTDLAEIGKMVGSWLKNV